MSKLAILGGGLTGLTLGSLIKGCEVEVLERERRCGGLCRSNMIGGFTFDIGGGHIIYSRDESALNFMRGQLEGNIVQLRRNTKVFYKGRYVKYPFENGLSDLPLQDNYECLLTYIQTRIRAALGRNSQPENFKEWIYYTFGEGIAEKYMIPYNEKVWNYDLSKMGIGWIADRVPQPPLEDIVKSSLGIGSEGYTHQLNFNYPRVGGIQALIESLRQKVEGDVTCNYNVGGIRNEDGKWILSDGSGNREKQFDILVSTIPPYELVKALSEVPSDVREAVGNLRYNSLITVMVGVDKPKLNDFSWAYFPQREDGFFNRLNFTSNYSSHVSPKGKSLVIAEITYNRGDEVDGMKDDELLEHTVDCLSRNEIVEREDVCMTGVGRIEYAYIVHDQDYEDNRNTMLHYLNSIGITPCGRFAEFEYLNMDACIKRAMRLAEQINNKNDTN